MNPAIPLLLGLLLVVLLLILRFFWTRPNRGVSEQQAPRPLSDEYPRETEAHKGQTRYTTARRMQLKSIARGKGWTRDAYHHVLRGQIAPGMDQDMVLLAWGGPSAVDHRTKTPAGVPVERWVYASVTDDSVQYVWFANGRVARVEQ